MPDLTNTVVGGRYRLERRLGSGGMGEVWAATDTRLARPVAVKILRSALAGDPAVRLRFESEARSAARLHHPNVVAVFDAGADGDDGGAAQLWLVMERLPGPTLADSMARGTLSPAEVRAVAADLLAGLAAAHEANLVHRDIKPSNVLRAADGTWKIADFGIAKPLDTTADLTATGATIGTPSYLSPEQLEGRPATPASDLWAVGVVLYEALAGRKPFVGDTPFAVAHAVRSAEPEPIAAIRPDIDPALSTAITSALAKDPGLRPGDAAAMAAMLGGEPPSLTSAPAVLPLAAAGTAAATGPDATPPSPSLPPPASSLPPRAPSPPPRAPAVERRPWGWIAAAAILVFATAVIALAATGAFSNDNSPGNPTTTSVPSTSTSSTTPPGTRPPSTTAAPPTTAASTTTTAPPTTTSTSAPPTTPSSAATTTPSTPRTTTPTTTGTSVPATTAG